MNLIPEAEIRVRVASTVMAVVAAVMAVSPPPEPAAPKHPVAATPAEEIKDPANYLFTNPFLIIILSSVRPACSDDASSHQGKIEDILFYSSI